MALAAVQIKWGAYYRVGVAEVDTQHEEIAQMLNDLCATAGRPTSRGAQVEAFHAIVDAVAEHFETEEKLMRRSACPDYDLHKAEHDFFSAQLLNAQEQIAGGQVEIDETLLVYLRDWLRNHILVADRRMGRHLQSRGRS